jgi:hypothetical protein
MSNHDQHYYRILSQIETGRPLTQRSVARDLGIALGLANLLMKQLARKGYVKMRSALDGNEMRYLLTSRGLAEKTRLSMLYLENTIERYAEARDRIRVRFEELPNPSGNGDGRPRVVLYGTGEVAEIAYIVANHSSVRVVGIVDDNQHQRPFLGFAVASPDQLAGPNGLPEYDHVIVTVISNYTAIAARLNALNVPPEKIHFL